MKRQLLARDLMPNHVRKGQQVPDGDPCKTVFKGLARLACRSERKGRRMKTRVLFVTLALAFLLTNCAQPVVPATPTPVSLTPSPVGESGKVFADFENELEYLRQQLKIPGFSAAIVKDQELIWARGFGYADLENQVEATPDTPYRLASVTKPIAATLIMQLVEEGTLSLDDPVSNYGVELESDGAIQVWHLLTHTSEGVPGTRHNYDGDRYSRLGAVVEGATGKSFGELLSERILEPLNMTNTAPSYAQCALAELADSAEAGTRGYNEARVNNSLASPYQLDGSYNIVEGAYPAGFSPAAGLISTVVDLAKFDIALDQGVLLQEEVKEQMFEPAVSTYMNRTDLMYGLGWYSQTYKGTRLLWHSGRWAPSVSALYLKVPDEGLTFFILANTAHLTTPFPLGDGDVLYSTVAETFYRTFVFPEQYEKTVPRIDWASNESALLSQLEQVTDEDIREMLERELWSHRQLFASVGRAELADRLLAVHHKAYAASDTSNLDLHAVRGVDYLPVISAKLELDDAALQRFVGEYVLGDVPDSARDLLPAAVTIELKQGQLLGVAPDMGCISLVPIASTRFALPENPALTVAFHFKEDRVDTMILEAAGIEAVYTAAE
jgi:CubicO group peptidase (beta-lactamase class C family)